MPYKRDDSPYYYTWLRRLPSYPSVRMSTGVTSKAVAREIERLLKDLAQRALIDPTWYELLDAVCQERAISLTDLLKAKHQRRLDALRKSLNDPLLSDVIDAFEATLKGRRRGVRNGLSMLRQYARELIGPEARLSDLTGKQITRLCVAAEADDRVNDGDGRKRNSVIRMQLRAISLLLRHEIGDAERDRIFAEVKYSPVDDTREVTLLPSEIRSLLEACATKGYDELATLIRLALQTSADRGVLLAGRSASKVCRGLLARDVQIFQKNDDGGYIGEVYLHDEKTNERSRTVPLTDQLSREMLVLLRGKAPDDPVFTMTYPQLDFPWQEVREAAGLAHVRFKDLRAQVSQYGEEAGVPQTILTKTYGHSDEAMTRRYQKRQAAMSHDQAEMIEQAMYREESAGEIRRIA